jgi:hypothetical protein
MKEKIKFPKVKPIPKYILTRIQKLDHKLYPEQNAVVRFYSYLTSIKKDLTQITVAVKNYRKKWYCKQITVRPYSSPYVFVKDFEYCGWGYGYHVGWYDLGIQSCQKWYERGWCYAEAKYYDPYAPVVNIGYVKRFSEYKYSASELLHGSCVIKYLQLYRQYPQTEYLLKMGLHRYVFRITLLRKIGKDKSFRTWLIAHRDELSACCYYVSVILEAYKTGKTLQDIQRIQETRKSFYATRDFDTLKGQFKGKDLEPLFLYIQKQQTSLNSYQDYFKACLYLKLDMRDLKNRFPHDFKHWHDIRIDQYHTAKAEENAREKATLYQKFMDVATKYLPLQKENSRAYVAIIAKSPAELINEGDVLHHCVGRMNYDQKFAREESLIFFIRLKSDMGTPFVTVEYSLRTHQVIQCYGKHDCKPNEEVLRFVYKNWLPYANKQLKQIKETA